ncbi:hypothetical protein Pmani_036976 [Petrolisthes manimaculis]|uniref:DDHD domain-containing protein n=1 Tax=Petrolisthes manimaculis TaxID=1843537 RepID=A0AAE1NJ50_9EUCA|nr:hypothetical protein Pmani_036976 [Petrolisthes manimaculis]KAK4290110.1 hypothetical protein Pmani_036976 [Petrolisthes manimaculis]
MDATPIPYTEQQAVLLEEAYRVCVVSGKWHSAVEQEDGSRVVLHSPRALVHFTALDTDFPTPLSANGTQAPLTVRRGTEDFEIEDRETETVNHLLLIVHGIGSVCDLKLRPVHQCVCDLKLRPVHQCVDDFRKLGRSLLSTHFREAVEAGEAGRVEVLPISWHKALHGEATGIDEKLRPITLRSIPKLREFTNDTILDALLYTSPVYCQHIIDTVASEMDRLYSLYKRRNPGFEGRVSVAGHSLGSVILFDILMNQKDEGRMKEDEEKEEEEEERRILARKGRKDSKVEYRVGEGGTGQPTLNYPQLAFHPTAFFLIGSPLSMFITVRGIEAVGLDFYLPTCGRVLNIFHPFDPVAYRLEALVDPILATVRPVLVPHHKGRKRMHLELKETLERVGTDLRQKIVESIQGTWKKLYQYYNGSGNGSDGTTSPEVVDQEKLTEQLLLQSGGGGGEEVEKEGGVGGVAEVVEGGVNKFGRLNAGRRIDYVLQEKPYESFNEYIFALQAHLTYWESEDTMLLILKELYTSQNILPDCQRNTTTTTTASSPVQQSASPLEVSPVSRSDSPSVPLIPTSSILPSSISSSFYPPPSSSFLPSSSLPPPSIPPPSIPPSPFPPPPPPSFSPLPPPPSFSAPPPPSFSPSLTSPPLAPPPLTTPPLATPPLTTPPLAPPPLTSPPLAPPPLATPPLAPPPLTSPPLAPPPLATPPLAPPPLTSPPLAPPPTLTSPPPPRVLGGRPVNILPQTSTTSGMGTGMGMDPTTTPTNQTVPPPPKMAATNLTRLANLRR